MSLDEYKLSHELVGHSLDVRAVAEGKNCLVSGSRDKTVKIWEQKGNEYHETMTLKDHTNFISSICLLNGGEWICTGGNDSKICIYLRGNLIPFTVLTDHTSTICALAPGLESGTLISGSWDTTARIYTLGGFGQTTSVCLKGHQAAVWAVAVLNKGQFVTGSADKTIAFWNRNGERLKVLKGHDDCVRGLIALPDNSLISCGNDAAIKLWNDDGECVKELFGHSNYIYTIAMNPFLGDSVVVSAGEDSTIRMWDIKTGPLGKEIKLPAQSIWSVACMANGDIVTGSSDGIVRIFTRDSSRFANEQKIAAFNAAVCTRETEANLKLGGINVNELPGPESLRKAGNPGQTKIVRHPDGKIMCYQWTKNEWICVGDVTGASGGTQDTSGKVLYEGKEYDFVFNVDLSDTDPPIKLPYNKGEDPWLVAQQFIHKHELPQVYLEQVANFIIKNSNSSVPHVNSNAFYDPFTGGSRYVPGLSSHLGDGGGDMVDPFTGASSYRTAESSAPTTQNIQAKLLSTTVKHFPWSQYNVLDTCDSAKVLNKIKEFNASLDDQNLRVDNEDIEKLTSLTVKENLNDFSAIVTLSKLMNWPKEKLFPILDIARLAVCNETVCSKFILADNLQKLLENLECLPANQMMVTRLFSNIMLHPWGRGLLDSQYKEVVKRLIKIRSGSNNLQIAIATFYLNMTVSLLKLANPDICRMTTEGILELLKWSTDLETQYRAYQALGNITCTPFGTVASTMIISVDNVVERLRQNMSATVPSGFEKLNELARDLTSAL